MKNTEAQIAVQLMNGELTETHRQQIKTLLTIARLAKKHHRLAEMDCNGEGWIRGQRYYAGIIDDQSRRMYGDDVRSAYVWASITTPPSEETIFTHELHQVEKKITALVQSLGADWRVEFQNDPRGLTVKVYHENRFITLEAR